MTTSTHHEATKTHEATKNLARDRVRVLRDPSCLREEVVVVPRRFVDARGIVKSLSGRREIAATILRELDLQVAGGEMVAATCKSSSRRIVSDFRRPVFDDAPRVDE